MRTRSILGVLMVVGITIVWPALGDDWKDTSGQGRWWRGEWKEEFWDGPCEVKREAKRGEFKREIKCKDGAGKTACMPRLRQLLPQVALYDFDAVGVPPHAGVAWRQQTTEHWLQHALIHQAEHQDTIICGGALLGEILACPSALQVDGIAVCLLDCADVVRIDRLRARGTHGATQDMLNWAAWQRLHAVDPQWRPDVIQTGAAPGMQWARWATWQRGDPRWQVWVLDTTTLSLDEVAERIACWVHEQQIDREHLGRH